MTDELCADQNLEMSSGREKTEYWGGVFAMTLCTFAMVALEFLPVSLLTPMASDLQVSEGAIGQGISISGAFAVVAGLGISLLGSMNRKTLLLFLTAVMLISSALVGIAESYSVYMVGRALIGLALGGFWSISAACVMKLVPLEKVPKALAVLIGAYFTCQFTLYTYIRPFLETVTQVNASTLSLLLLTVGVSGFIGTLLVGSLLQKSLYFTLGSITLLMALLAIGFILFGAQVGAVTVMLALWGLASTSAPVGWWTWLARTLPDNAEGGGGLMVSVIQLAIGLGSTLGGLLLDAQGVELTFMTSSALLIAATLLVMLSARQKQIH